MKKRILFVDDDQRVLDAWRRMLHSQRDVWEVTCVCCPKAAWEMVQESSFDAVVADEQMPGMSGLELLARIRVTPRTEDIPVIILTGLAARELRRRAWDLGAADLLSKPVEPEDLVARLRSVLRLKEYADALRAQNELLEEHVRARTRELLHARLDIIWRLGKAAEHRDDSVGNHVIRVGCASRVIAEVLGLDRDFVETLFLAAPLHDIGKIGIPDAVLLKRGPLSPGEWEVMKRHCRIGARILREDGIAKTAFWEWRDPTATLDDPDERNPFLEMAASVALAHHERWDGSGYPRGLAGEDIPLEARIVAISDVFDAVTSRRPYKEAYDEDRALEIICSEEVAHFDPDVLTAFLDALPEIRSIGERFADTPGPRTPIEETADEADLVRR